MGEPTSNTEISSAQAELEQLRGRHQVTPVDRGEEGRSLEQISRGRYGFTYAPGQERTPVFLKKGYQSFEVHKLPDGAERLVGFVSPKEADEIAKGGHNLEITLYPDPWDKANRLVNLRFDEIVISKKGPSRGDGNYLGVRLL